MKLPRRPAHAEVVGSLLRPPALREAVEGFYERGHSAVLAEERSKDRTALRELEDSAIREAVRRQIDLGLDVVTDGEFRRWMFLNSFYDAVEGVPHRQRRQLPERPGRGRPAPGPRDRRAATSRGLARRPRGRVHDRDRRRAPLQGHVPRAVALRPPVLLQAGRHLRVRVARGVRRRTPSRSSARSSPTPSRPARGTSSSTSRSIRYLVDPMWVERFEARGHPVARSRRRRHRGRYRRARGHPRRA